MRTRLGCLIFLLLLGPAVHAEEWPALPEQNGAVEIPAQEWPLRPGPRRVRVLVHYPGEKLANVGERTGLMLTLHNWGGTDCVGTASPTVLAEKLNVVALCVNYLQSGPKDSIEGPEPYDFGYLQSLDALRALWWLDHGLKSREIKFAGGRVFATGGSGGGNVALMCNKLAPLTFACIIDLCGMKKLSDDIAFNLPGGSDLNARYSRDPNSPNYLSLDRQELCFVGNPDHLAILELKASQTRIVTVHGVDDTTCPYPDAVEMVHWMRRAGLDVEPRFITKDQLDGKVFTSTGHALGNRTEIVLQLGAKYLSPSDPDRREHIRRLMDFERRDVSPYPTTIRYRTSNGAFEIDYSAGYPVGRVVPNEPLPEYPNHQDLSFVLDSIGAKHAIKFPGDWFDRCDHIVRHFQRVAGPLPSLLRRVPLDVKVLEEVKVGTLTRRKLSFQSDPTDRVTAYLFLPSAGKSVAKRPAVLCLQQTTNVGKDEPAGIRGDPNLKYALDLAERGYVTLAPDYPSFGEHAYDFDPKHGYVSGTMKAIWDNIRAVDLLETLPEVDAERIGCIGHSLGGHNAIFTAVFERRLKAIVSSCGFSSMQKDDVPSWTGPRYMPLIASEFKNDPKLLPFDFHELVAALAPRPFFASAATKDNDFDVTGVKDVLDAARPIYALYGKADDLVGHYPEAGHSFPDDSRRRAYEFLDRALRQ
ncbi:MAG: alpha/beta fold hydrolase [Planctomycetaceae bacterium]|nr:alpha/beta fold hydrolase [Planctomycetaceae bacterium]